MTGLVEQSPSSGGPSKDVPEGKGYLIVPRAHKMSLAKASPSASMSKQSSILPLNPLQQGSGAAQGKGVSAVGDGAFPLSPRTSQDLMDWNMGAYSPSNEYNPKKAASFQWGDGYKALPPQFEDSYLQEPPQGVSEPREQMSHALAKASPSASMSKQGSVLPLNPLQQGSGGAGAPTQEASQGKGVSAVGDDALQLSSGTSQDLPDWIIQAYSPSNEFDSEVAAFYQQGDGYEALLPQFEVSNLHDVPQGDNWHRPNKMSDTLGQAPSSASMSKQGSGGAGAPQGKEVSAGRVWSFASSAGTSQSQDQTGWNMGGYSPSNEYDSEMAAFYKQGDGSKGSDMQELPQGVSEPYLPSLIVQTSSGYKRSRISATTDQYSFNQGPEAFGVYPENWVNSEMPGSTKRSDFKM